MNDQQPSLPLHFHRSTGNLHDYKLKVLANIGLLIDGLKKYETKASVNTPDAEIDIQKKFREFLIGCEFHMALSDFDDLLNESEKKPRDDGTTAWHHQLSQTLMFLSLVKDKTITLDMLEEYGGLETAVRTCLRHDSIEDFGKSFEQFENEQKQKIEEKYTSLFKRGIKDIDQRWLETEYKNLSILMSNLKLMTKKIAVLDDQGNPQYRPDGRLIKKDLFSDIKAYIHNMLDNKDASPVVWILKTFDGTHNLSTMLGAPKFTSPRRLKYCNEREDMYGGRDSLPERAMDKWSSFRAAIRRADHIMGSVLYGNFGYLNYVDQKNAYPDDETKHRDGKPIYISGIVKYLSGALSFDIPRGLNPLHTFLDTIKDISVHHEAPLTQQRAELFWNQSITPALKEHLDHFKIILNSPQNSASHGTPPKAARSPQFF